MTRSAQLALPLLEAAPSEGFDLTTQIERLVCEIVAECPGFAHVDPSRLVISGAATRNRSRFGKYASIFPLRFEGGASVQSGRRVAWYLPRVEVDGRDILYALFFYIPRFFTLDAARRLSVVFHELHHISDKFDGDLRRFPGHFHYHGKSVKHFEDGFRDDLDRFLASGRARRFECLLEYSLPRLMKRYGAVVWRRVPQPRLARRQERWSLCADERAGLLDASSIGARARARRGEPEPQTLISLGAQSARLLWVPPSPRALHALGDDHGDARVVSVVCS
ncbi:MAG: hypothetical protein ACKVU1_05280 [bacterium]